MPSDGWPWNTTEPTTRGASRRITSESPHSRTSGSARIASREYGKPTSSSGASGQPRGNRAATIASRVIGTNRSRGVTSAGIALRHADRGADQDRDLGGPRADQAVAHVGVEQHGAERVLLDRRVGDR